MSSSPNHDNEARNQPRLKLPAMYTLLRVRHAGTPRYRWTGYIYDISTTGMRFELDASLEPGTKIDVRGMLPGARHTTIRATGHVIRLQDDEDSVGPFRMAMSFESFSHHIDRNRLLDYLSHSDLRAA